MSRIKLYIIRFSKPCDTFQKRMHTPLVKKDVARIFVTRSGDLLSIQACWISFKYLLAVLILIISLGQNLSLNFFLSLTNIISNTNN